VEVIDLTSDSDDEGNRYEEESEYSFGVLDDDSVDGDHNFLDVVRRFLSFF
jgi:hypothetical protein